jgi:hypothetical protein
MRGRATRAAVALIALVAAALVYVPIAPAELDLEPDLSFRAAMHDFFARGVQWGENAVSPYGPWALLQRGYDRRTDAVVLLVSALLAAVFAWSATRIAYDAGGNAAAAAAIASVAALCLVPPNQDACFTVLALLLVLSALLPPSLARDVPLVAALGVLALIKFSLLAFALFAVVMTMVLRRRAIYGVVFVAAFALAWFAAGQHLASFPPFLRWGFEVTRGWSGAMASGSGVPIAAIGAAGLALVAAAVERNAARWIFVAGTLAYLVKIGYVRGDATHQISADALLGLFALAYLFLRRDRLPRIVVAVAALAAAVVVTATLPSFAYRVGTQWSWLHGRAAQLRRLEHDVARNSGAALVPAVAGTIDAYPWGAAALIARGMRYAPRPTVEGYIAWTPALAARNAAFLRGPRAPEWLWTGVGSIDGRYPLLDDAPSWLEMLSRYDVAATTTEHLLLHRRATPRPLVIVPLASVAANDVAVPNEPMVWCTIETHPSIADRLRDVFGRPSLLTLEMTTAAGAQTRWKVPRAMLAGGFVVSPQVADAAALSRFFARDSADRVTRIRLNGDDVVVRFSAVRVRAN